MSNNLKNTRIEFHILQSFPVSCLNRDDSGSPKSAIIGGTQRARVSSQCWKRAVRLAMHEIGVQVACRTRLVNELIQDECEKLGATPEDAKLCGDLAFWAINNGTANRRNKTLVEQISKISENHESDKKKNESQEEEKKEKKTDKIPLAFISESEIEEIAKFFKETDFKMPTTPKEAGNLFKCLESLRIIERDGLDIALFGRMAASLPKMNVEAAASFAHAISTHKAAAEVEFFTAVDDKKTADDIQGAGHMGSLEFNSATYYRYISIDLGKLYENLGEGDLDLTPAIAAFTKALFLAVPGARQATMAANSPWDFAKVLVRKGQRLQVSFEDAVRTSRENPSLLKASRAALETQLDRFEKISGSLFGKIATFDFGEDTSFSIDDLVESLAGEVRKLQEAR